jgi:hypothetical protein
MNTGRLTIKSYLVYYCECVLDSSRKLAIHHQVCLPLQTFTGSTAFLSHICDRRLRTIEYVWTNGRHHVPSHRLTLDALNFERAFRRMNVMCSSQCWHVDNTCTVHTCTTMPTMLPIYNRHTSSLVNVISTTDTECHSGGRFHCSCVHVNMCKCGLRQLDSK